MNSPFLLTERQQAVLDFIRQTIAASGDSPTVREIGAHFSIASPNGVMCHLKALEEKGFIRRQALVSRGISLE